MSLTHYILKGSFLNIMQRDQIWDQRAEIYSGKCSGFFKSRLTSLSDKLAKQIINIPDLTDFFRASYSKETPQSNKDEANQKLASIVYDELKNRKLI
jgi:endoglucanase Acf2